MNDVIDVYLLVKEGEGRAKSTLKEYRLYLSAFAAYCNKSLTDVTNTDIARWMALERSRGLADASMMARHRALRIFFNWCVVYGYLEQTPLKMRNPKIKRQIPRIANLADVRTLLRMPSASWVDTRNKAMVHLLLDTGMRIGEAVSLYVAHVDLSQRLVSIPAGKDKEARQAPFTQDCADVVGAYLDERPVSPWGKWLFIGSVHRKAKGRLKTSGARCMFVRICKAAGIPYINPHSLRHLFATKALNDGIRIETVSRILGHSSVDLTMRVYANLLTATIQQEYESNWTIL